MELYLLQTFLTVATEKSFSRAGEKLLRTQPAVSLAIQRLESELGEKLIDRSGKELLLTDAGRIVTEYARRFDNLRQDLENALAELRDNAAGRLIIGANESTTLYLLHHIERYRHTYPKIKVQVRRSLSSKMPGAVDRRRPGTGPHQLRSGRRPAGQHRHLPRPPGFRGLPGAPLRAARKSVSISELGMETFIAHNVLSPYREVVVKEFQRRKVAAQHGRGDADGGDRSAAWCSATRAWRFCRGCASSRSWGKACCAKWTCEELHVDRNIRLVYPARRALSHAARAFLELVRSNPLG